MPPPSAEIVQAIRDHLDESTNPESITARIRQLVIELDSIRSWAGEAPDPELLAACNGLRVAFYCLSVLGHRFSLAAPSLVHAAQAPEL